MHVIVVALPRTQPRTNRCALRLKSNTTCVIPVFNKRRMRQEVKHATDSIEVIPAAIEQNKTYQL